MANVLSGPVLGALALIVGKGLGKVVGIMAQEASSLLSMNSAAEKRAQVQNQLNDLLRQATQQEKAELNVCESVLLQKEKILEIQARINQEALLGTNLQNSMIRESSLGMYKRDPGLLKSNLGKIPRFADPIASAIARESKASGLPTSQIYVDRDTRVANFANPLGLLVANKRDEPMGGFQGVNRVLSQGGNPQTSGIPNFAPFTSAELRMPSGGFAAVKDLNSLFDGLRKAAPLSNEWNKLGASIFDFSKGLNKLSESKVLTKLAQESTRAAFAKEVLSKTVSDQSRYSPYVPPYGGTLGEIQQQNAGLTKRNPFGNDLIPGPPNGGVLGPAYPINPELQKRMGEEADINAEIRAAEQTDKRFRASQNRRRKKAAEIVTGRQKMQSRAFMASFVLPFAGGFIEPGAQALGVNTGGGTSGGMATGALGGAAQGAGWGGLFGPQGLAIGAAIGALVGGFSKLSKSAEELNADFEKGASARSEEVSSLGRALQAQEELNNAKKEGATQEVLRRLEEKVLEARSGVKSERARGILDLANPKLAALEQDKFQKDEARKSALASVQNILQTGGSGESLRGGLSRAIEGKDASKISDEQLRSLAVIAGKNYSPLSLKDYDEHSVGGLTSAQEAQDTLNAAEDFKKAAETLAPFAALAGISKGDIKTDTINKIAKELVFALVDKRSEAEKAAERAKAPSSAILPTSYLANPLDNNVISKAITMGKVPYGAAIPTEGQRSQAQLALYNEFEKSGFTTKEELANDPNYKRVNAGSQKENFYQGALTQLGAAGYDTRRFRNKLGLNTESIKRVIGFGAERNDQNQPFFKILQEMATRVDKSALEAGVKPINAPYGLWTGSPKRTATNAAAMDDFSGSLFGPSPKIGPSSSGFMSMTDLKAKIPTDRSFDLSSRPKNTATQIIKETSKAVDELNAKALQAQIKVSGAIELISKGMEPQMVAVLTQDISNAVIEAGKKYFAGIDLSARVDALDNRVSRAEGKPMPPKAGNPNVPVLQSVQGGDPGPRRMGPLAYSLINTAGY